MTERLGKTQFDVKSCFRKSEVSFLCLGDINSKIFDSNPLSTTVFFVSFFFILIV